MTYEETKRMMMTAWPRLFVDEADVLKHLFFIAGNGYEWENGELTDGVNNPARTIQQAKEDRDRWNNHLRQKRIEVQQRFDAFVDGLPDGSKGKTESLAKRALRGPADDSDLESDDAEVERAKELKQRLEYAADSRLKQECYFLRPDGTLGRVLSTGRYAHVLCVPEDVKADWLAAARQALVVARAEFRLTAADERWIRRAERRLNALVKRNHGETVART